MLSLNGNFTTLADFNLGKAAKPVLDRQKDIQRKRNARKLQAAQREHARKLQAQQDALAQAQQERAAKLTIICASGRIIRPIK
jgi:hypothetical protein